jgi:hypothetical protein
MPIVDTLLRLAEEPAFYTPKWSPHILQEVRETLQGKFGYSPEQVQRRIGAIECAFPDAMVTGYEGLIPIMANDAEDRHVLAAAVKCGAHSIVSDNVKHFPAEALSPCNLECLTADDFMTHQYHLNPDAFIGVLVEQARDIGWTLPQLISKHVPALSKLIITH